MSGETAIEWTDATWNPTTGCDRVSPGCDHCYAMTLAKRLKGMGSAAYQIDGDPATSGPGFLAHEWPRAIDWPLHKRKPLRIFVNSMSDLFHANVSDDYIVRVFAVMRRAHWHTFQILTKRHARMRALLSSPDFEAAVIARVRRDIAPLKMNHFWPLPNVWLGVSVENQQWADIRVPALIDTPAAVRFLSCEPLLGPTFPFLFDSAQRRQIDWVIVGGESGLGARPMHPRWARSLRDQCQTVGVPFLFKQWGDWAPVEPDVWQNRVESDWDVRADGYCWPIAEPHGAEDGTNVTMRRYGKKTAGRVLDGRTWDEYPASVAASFASPET